MQTTDSFAHQTLSPQNSCALSVVCMACNSKLLGLNKISNHANECGFMCIVCDECEFTTSDLENFIEHVQVNPPAYTNLVRQLNVMSAAVNRMHARLNKVEQIMLKK